MRLLHRLFAERAVSTCLKSENGPDFIAAAVQHWLVAAKVRTRSNDPGKPRQNGHTESFHAVLRDSCLKHWLFSRWQRRERFLAELVGERGAVSASSSQ
jgi:putative transposase